jgi:hypothetical protein
MSIAAALNVSVPAFGAVFMISTRMPLWLRVVSLVGVVILVTGAGLFAYRYYTRPVTLTLAVGSLDGEAAKAIQPLLASWFRVRRQCD